MGQSIPHLSLKGGFLAAGIRWGRQEGSGVWPAELRAGAVPGEAHEEPLVARAAHSAVSLHRVCQRPRCPWD